ncbi:hypothetical protein [Ensifer aridi]|uniref:hypothetical protein n=1 Tax=Ensifer aridi TaxID=1708715 RepID=UPI0009C0E719|nr:hypothetical protein [Ensifer aridi]
MQQSPERAWLGGAEARRGRNFRSRQTLAINKAVPVFDWRATKAYAALSDADREKLHHYVDRFNESGLAPFTDAELHEFELLIFPFAKEEQGDADQL